MKKITKTTIIAFAILFGTVSALQADVITDWQFSVNSVFTQWLGQTDYDNKGEVQWQQATENTTAGINFNNDYTQMRWNSSDGRASDLELASHSGTITTDGSMETALTMTHNNSVIGAGSPAPKIMEITIDVLLTGIHENNDVVTQNLKMSLLLGFIETPNKNGSLINGHTEDDIFFIVANPSTTQRFKDNYGNVYDASMDAVFEEITGVHLDTALYYIDSRIGDYYELGELGTLYGWSTLEGQYQENAMDVNIVVRHTTMPTTPEPATMLIFAVAGALGLPACRKWRKNAKR